MIEENLQLPFETNILGMPVQVVSVDIRDHDNGDYIRKFQAPRA